MLNARISVAQLADIFLYGKLVVPIENISLNGNQVTIKQIYVGEEIILNLNTTQFDFFFDNCKFEKNFILRKFVSPGQITFKECIFNGHLVLEKPELNKLFWVDGCLFEASLIISGGKFEDIWIDTNCESVVEISGGEFRNLMIGNLNFHRDEIGQIRLINGLWKGQIDINNIQLGSLQVSGTQTKDCVVKVSLCSISFLGFESYINEGSLRLYDIVATGIKNTNKQKKTDPEYISNCFIRESNLGKAEFYNVNLRSFNKLYLSKSNLIDVTFNNVIWPHKIYSFDNDRKEYTEKEKLSDKREMYRQIKLVYSKNGSIVNEQKFHGYEMNTYYESLDWTWKTGPSKVVVGLSYLSGNYGQSVLGALLFLIVVNGFLFSLLVLSGDLKNIYFIPVQNVEIKGVLLTISEFLSHLNPLRKFDTDNLKGISLILDLLMRIVSSYAIYNIIKATRRFVR